jgi:hypothetical protein
VYDFYVMLPLEKTGKVKKQNKEENRSVDGWRTAECHRFDVWATFLLAPSSTKRAPRLYADFKNVDFQNANFQNVDLQNVDLQNVDLQNVDFQNVDFQNVDFQNFDFQNANFQNVKKQLYMTLDWQPP